MKQSHQTIDQDHVLSHDDLYFDRDERMKHFREIQLIALESGRSIFDVTQLYEEVLENVKSRAQISNYLPILVAKKVRNICKRTH